VVGGGGRRSCERRGRETLTSTVQGEKKIVDGEGKFFVGKGSVTLGSRAWGDLSCVFPGRKRKASQGGKNPLPRSGRVS